MTFDVVIHGARVVPADAPPAVADVGITGDRIDAVEPWLAASVAGEVIDGGGRLLCPGFIDLHAQSALEPFEDPTLFPKIAQGFTTELINPDGLAPPPVAPDGGLQRRRYLAPLEGSGPREWTWSTIEEYALALDATGPVGKSIADIAEERRSGPVTAFLDLLVDTDLQVAMIDHYATEETVRAIFQHPLGLVGSDGIFSERPHPRLHGTAARVLGRYAIREQLVTPNEAVARLTARAADRIGLTDRGRIRLGLCADPVLIDPERFVDRATYEDPCQAPDGVVRVWVASRTVLRDGAPTGERHGGVLCSPPAP